MVASKSPSLDNKIFALHVRAFIHSLTKIAIDRPSEGNGLNRLHDIKHKQVIRLATSLQQMDMFKNDAEIDIMLEEFRRQDLQQGRGAAALSDFDTSDDEGFGDIDPIFHFDDSDYE